MTLPPGGWLPLKRSLSPPLLRRSAFGPQTYAIELSFPGSVSSTSGCRVAVISPSDAAVSSTARTLLSANWIQEIKVTPGQRVSAVSNDAGTFSLSITELTKMT